MEHLKKTCHSLQKDLFNSVLHAPIIDHLTLILRGFVVGSQILNLTANPSFDHNSHSRFKWTMRGHFNIYISRPFQWYLRGLIWCFVSFSAKALNIQDFRISVIPKVGVYLGVIGLHPLHSPPFVIVCFTFEHTLLTSWAHTLHWVATQR